MEKSKLEASYSSPLATVEEIQKRLLRPPNSQSLASFNSSRDHQCDVMSQGSSHMETSFYEIHKIREAELKIEVTNRRLEDYLDPVLLSAIRGKICGKRKTDGDVKFKRRYSSDFDQFEKWLGNHDHVVKETKFEKNEAVDLKNDSDRFN